MVKTEDLFMFFLNKNPIRPWTTYLCVWMVVLATSWPCPLHLSTMSSRCWAWQNSPPSLANAIQMQPGGGSEMNCRCDDAWPLICIKTFHRVSGTSDDTLTVMRAEEIVHWADTGKCDGSGMLTHHWWWCCCFFLGPGWQRPASLLLTCCVEESV